MGLINDTKKMFGMGGDGKGDASETAGDWVDDVNSEVESVDGEMGDGVEMEVDTEPVEQEWDSAYRFAEEFLEMHGFASMVDFTNKCMAYKINQSPMYRDRISHGVQTMNQITSMKDQIEQVQGNGNDVDGYGEYAEKLEDANRVINQAQKLNGEEEEMVREVLSLGHEFADAFTQRQMAAGQQANVQSSVSSVNEEM